MYFLLCDCVWESEHVCMSICLSVCLSICVCAHLSAWERFNIRACLSGVGDVFDDELYEVSISCPSCSGQGFDVVAKYRLRLWQPLSFSVVATRVLWLVGERQSLDVNFKALYWSTTYSTHNRAPGQCVE